MPNKTGESNLLAVSSHRDMHTSLQTWLGSEVDLLCACARLHLDAFYICQQFPKPSPP